MNKKKRRICHILLALLLAGAAAVFGIDAYVRHTAAPRILSAEKAAALQDAECVLVLGCSVRPDGSPSLMLHDRMQTAIALFRAGATPKLLVSGDHGTEGYDEVNTMKRIAMEAEIPDTDIFMDHAGFSTYESIYRAKQIFGVKKMIIVTQTYHLYRALYLAQSFGIEAYGVPADSCEYPGQTVRDLREVLARLKDFGYSILKPKPTFLGDPIPITGNGNATNDN